MSEEVKATEVVEETKAAEAPVEGTPAEGEKAPRENRRPRGDRRNDRRGPRKDDRRDQPKEFEERVVFINRVSKTVKGGRRMKFTALVVIGDKKGRYGFALAKAQEVLMPSKRQAKQLKRTFTTSTSLKEIPFPTKSLVNMVHVMFI